MKKKFLHVLALTSLMVFSQGVKATTNIYASGLTGELQGSDYNITYVLNEVAVSGEFQVINTDGDVIKSIPLTSLNKGANTATIDPDDVPVGTYRWQIKVTADGSVATPTKKTDNAWSQLQFWAPRGVAIDNNPESAYFGRVYVSETQGGTVTNRTTQNGIYILDPLFADVTSQGATSYKGGQTWNATSSPFRICVAPDGRVFMSDFSDGHSGVYIMDPANPSGAFTQVFGGSRQTSGLFINGGVDVGGSTVHCYVTGEGENMKLFTLDEDYIPAGTGNTGNNLLQYNLGTNTSWDAAPSAVVFASKNLLLNGNCTIAPDGRGGWWIIQSRGTAEGNVSGCPSLIHINTSGAVNFNSGNNKPLVPYTVASGMAVSLDYKQLAMCTVNNTMVVYNITYDASDVPTLTTAYTITPVLGNNTQGLAFDVAGNLYVVSNTQERLGMWALPKTENTHTTPARSIYEITGTGTLTSLDDSSPSRFNVYPNPTRDMLTIKAEGELINTIRVFNITGGLVWVMQNVNNSEYTVDMSALPQGSYFVNINNKTVKVVKQ